MAYMYRVAQKTKPLPDYQSAVNPMKASHDVRFVKLKYQSNT